MAGKKLRAVDVPPPDGSNVADRGVHEYGYRILARVVHGCEEYWRVMPSGATALYVRYQTGRLVAHYRLPTRRISA